MKAQLIGESSAGMTAVEIFDNAGTLVWSHRWLEDCASKIVAQFAAWVCMYKCADITRFGGGALDEDGEPIVFNVGDTTGIMLEYDSDSKAWALGHDARGCGFESMEIVDACIIAGLIPADEDYEDREDNEFVKAAAKHIVMIINA